MEKLLNLLRALRSWLAAFLFLALLLVAYHGCSLYRQLKECERKYENLKVSVAGAKESLVRDSLPMSSTLAQVVYANELPRETTSLIKDAGERVKDVESIGTTATVIRDTILIPEGVAELHYADRWATIDIKDTLLSYEVRDSLTTIVTTDYKRRFLWWRWGKRGYMVKIVSHNPHSRVVYNEYQAIIK